MTGTLDVNSSVPAVDRPRLTGQIRRVYDCLVEGTWWTLGELSRASKNLWGCTDSEASISARLRDLRNLHGYTIQKRRRTAGQYEYKLDLSFLKEKAQ